MGLGLGLAYARVGAALTLMLMVEENRSVAGCNDESVARLWK